MTHSIEKRAVGRPCIPPHRRLVNMSVALTPAQAAWLRAQPNGARATVRSLVAKAMQRAANEPTVTKELA